MGACPMWPNQSAHAQQPLIAMQRRAPNDLSALAACQLQTKPAYALRPSYRGSVRSPRCANPTPRDGPTRQICRSLRMLEAVFFGHERVRLYWQGRDGAALHSLDWSATHGGSARGRAGRAGASAILSSRLSAIYWSRFGDSFCIIAADH
eukprot:scaffold55443_cov35-Phaeocystis_antarctica.AAC.2